VPQNFTCFLCILSNRAGSHRIIQHIFLFLETLLLLVLDLRFRFLEFRQEDACLNSHKNVCIYSLSIASLLFFIKEPVCCCPISGAKVTPCS
jgi:hypothetical protein